MNTVFDKKAYDELAQRLEQLSPAAQAKWGKMNVGQMLAHCKKALEMQTGETKPKRIFIGRIIGRFFKDGFTNDQPLKINSPTGPTMVITDSRDFEKERTEVSRLLKKMYEGGEKGATTHPHSFFGKLEPREWGITAYKHLDHHLRQFGA